MGFTLGQLILHFNQISFMLFHHFLDLFNDFRVFIGNIKSLGGIFFQIIQCGRLPYLLLTKFAVGSLRDVMGFLVSLPSGVQGSSAVEQHFVTGRISFSNQHGRQINPVDDTIRGDGDAS